MTGRQPKRVAALRFTSRPIERERLDPHPSAPPATLKQWKELGLMSMTALREMGLRAFDEPDVNGMVLMLFPGEWFDSIPEGFIVENILDEAHTFRRATFPRDLCVGCLSYGVRVRAR
jgi:hypothetical protein